MNEIAAKLQELLSSWNPAISVKDGYVRVWNCYAGTSAWLFTKALDAACAELGLRSERIRTAGPVGGSDWEDRVMPV